MIASALNADIEDIAVPYAAKVIRELFMNSAEAGSMGMSSVPLSELYAGAERFLSEHGSQVLYNTNVEGADWDEEASQWTVHTRGGDLISDYVVLALPFEATGKLLPNLPARRWRSRIDCARSSSTSTGPSAACICGSIARSRISSTPSCSTARFTGSTTRAACSRGAS